MMRRCAFVLWAARLHQPEAPPLVKLCPARAFVPPPHRQEDEDLDRRNEEVDRHDSYRDYDRAGRHALSSRGYVTMGMVAGPACLLP